MTKIVLYLWLLSPTGEFDKTVIEGFRSIADCEAVAAAFVTPNPRDGWAVQGVFRCVEIPK